MNRTIEEIVKAAQKLDQEERKKNNSPPQILQDLLIAKTKEFCKKLHADENIALIGAYLMDIQIGKAMREGRIKDHIEISVQFSQNFFKKFGLTYALQERIEQVMKAHHGQIPYGSIEAEIVANADSFKFLHPKGALFFLVDLGGRKMSFTEAFSYFEQKIEEKHKMISLDICKKEADEYYKLLRRLIHIARG